MLTMLMVAGANTLVITNTTQPGPGTTGAPGEFTCAQSSCHVGTEFTTTGIGFATVPAGQLANGYVPGQTYQLRIDISNIGSPISSNYKDGFLITALDGNNDSVGKFNTIPSPTTTSLSQTFDREYVGHKDANATAIWNFNWTAPNAGNGPVTFYIAALRSNNDNTAAGDRTYTQEFTIAEGTINPCTNFEADVRASGNVTTFCIGQSLELIASSANGPGNPNYNWSGNAANNDTVIVGSGGTYTVTVTEGGCADTASITVSSIAGGVPAFAVVVDDNTVIVNNSSTGVTGAYTWDFGDGTVLDDNSAAFSYVYDSLGTYTITLEYADVCGGNQTTTQAITISVISGLGEVSLAEMLRIYPNPFHTQTSIAVDGFDGVEFHIQLLDITGRTVQTLQGTGGIPLTINRDGLPSGMYLYSIDAGGQKAYGRLLVD